MAGPTPDIQQILEQLRGKSLSVWLLTILITSSASFLETAEQ
jgi:hypothetical protein